MKNTLLLSVLLVILIVAAVGASRVFAQTPAPAFSTLVQRIAQRFGLKESDVQSVFDQYKNDLQSRRQAALDSRLDADVKNGTITAAQKTLIENKLTQLQQERQTDRQNWANLTPQQRRQKLQSEHQDLQNWASQNHLNLQLLFPGRGMKFAHPGRWF
ncbi:hypothetical protein M1116_01415 [Patescibacteria group bacterium]|nr:hypothetical protein [Patescibacteria group bacterium]